MYDVLTLAAYIESGGKGKPTYDPAALILEKHEICSYMLHDFDWSKRTLGTPAEKLAPIPEAQEQILE